MSIGCHLSRAASANKTVFPHPVLYVSFIRSIVLVVTKITKGSPSQCVRYRHAYSKFVNLNDTDPTKAVIKAHPELFNREFVLEPYKPSDPSKNHWKPEYGREETGDRREGQRRGELARMREAGLVMQDLEMRI